MSVLQAYERARQARIHAYFMPRKEKVFKTTEMKSLNNNNLHHCCLIMQIMSRSICKELLCEQDESSHEKQHYDTLSAMNYFRGDVENELRRNVQNNG
ncbi:unnamed protein product [Rotaria sordida]|uniref:Uncharacterized protein n=1 Tax=Rotaria sordida TaxID=392033 RepID=A0A819T0L5_9BILA|nr:unnamed protein product [Rotaria sordida]